MLILDAHHPSNRRTYEHERMKEITENQVKSLNEIRKPRTGNDFIHVSTKTTNHFLQWRLQRKPQIPSSCRSGVRVNEMEVPLH